MSNARQAQRSHTSGQLAEALVRKVFGVEEPYVEVKAACRTYSYVKLPLVQLEQQFRLVYVVVVYDRDRRVITQGVRRGKRVHVLSIEQAFRKPVTFVVFSGEDAIDVIHAKRLPIERIKRSRDWGPRLLARVPVSALMGLCGPSTEIEGGHTLYGSRPDRVDDVPF